MKRYTFILILLGLVVCANGAFARDNDHARGHDRHSTYRYHHDRFYRPGLFGWAFGMAIPPIGAVITNLPSGHSVVTIGGGHYYRHGDVYFRSCDSGYMVVEQPVVVERVVEKTVIVPEADSVVNVPNGDGTYTTVKLVRKGRGYVGPQGEYYENNPSVEQLRVLYAKN
jgi:hypothetical protein